MPPQEYVLSVEEEINLEALLLNYRRGEPSVTSKTMIILKRQARQTLLAGGEVKLVHRPDSGFSIEMSLPKVKRRLKRPMAPLPEWGSKNG